MFVEAKDQHAYLRALHSNNPFELDKLSLSTDYFVRARVAGNHATPPPVLERFVEDISPAVSGSIPSNPNAGPGITALLEIQGSWRKSEYWVLRAALMSCPHTSPKTIEELHAYGDLNLKLGRVNRADCPERILKAYAEIPYERSPKTGDGGVGVILQIMRAKARRRLGMPILNEDEDY